MKKLDPAKTGAKTTKKVIAKTPRIKVGDIAKAGIRNGLTNEQVVELVKKEIPVAKTTIGCIAWYRNDMKKKGEKVPVPKDVEKRRAEKAQANELAKKQKADSKVQAKAKGAAKKASAKADSKAKAVAKELNK